MSRGLCITALPHSAISIGSATRGSAGNGRQGRCSNTRSGEKNGSPALPRRLNRRAWSRKTGIAGCVVHLFLCFFCRHYICSFPSPETGVEEAVMTALKCSGLVAFLLVAGCRQENRDQGGGTGQQGCQTGAGGHRGETEIITGLRGLALLCISPVQGA